jgi:acetyl-CoA carboxylase carboxyltransferase component
LALGRISSNGRNSSCKSFGSNSRISLKKQGKEISEEEHQALMEKITQNYTKQTKVEYSAARIWIDAIINPLDTRKWISMVLKLQITLLLQKSLI